MPWRPLRTSLVAASCGSLPSKKRPAIASSEESSVMVTDSVAFCAKAENSGRTNRGLGAAHARLGTSHSHPNDNRRSLMRKFLACTLGARALIGRRGLTFDRLVRQIQFLAGHAQGFDHFSPCLE